MNKLYKNKWDIIQLEGCISPIFSFRWYTYRNVLNILSWN